jgi:hypothetical protein
VGPQGDAGAVPYQDDMMPPAYAPGEEPF